MLKWPHLSFTDFGRVTKHAHVLTLWLSLKHGSYVCTSLYTRLDSLLQGPFPNNDTEEIKLISYETNSAQT